MCDKNKERLYKMVLEDIAVMAATPVAEVNSGHGPFYLLGTIQATANMALTMPLTIATKYRDKEEE